MFTFVNQGDIMTTSTQEGLKMNKTEITNLLSDVKNVEYYWEIGEYSEVLHKI